MESEIRNYKIMKYLSGGRFGDVYYIIDTIGGWNVPRAMKKISCNSEINKNQKKRVIKRGRKFSKFIVSYYESFI